MVVKGSREVDLLHVFSHIPTIFATFATHGALVPVWLKVIPNNNNVLILQPAQVLSGHILQPGGLLHLLLAQGGLRVVGLVEL